MGSGTKRKSTGQPQTAGTNGTITTETSGDENTDDKQEQVSVHLIDINRSVHENTNVGERALRNGPKVSVAAGVLGFVSEADLQLLTDNGLTNGQISRLGSDDDLFVTVTFTI